jgi:hypothetical protein
VSGLTDLDRLVCEMRPTLKDGLFVFCSLPFAEAERLRHLDALGTFREEEGMTLILPVAVAAGEGIACSAPMRLITLSVHSSLEAVGLTAAIATALSREGISANVVAAFHHDHVFVPAADGERALQVLTALSGSGA